MLLANLWLFLFRIFYTRRAMHHFAARIFPMTFTHLQNQQRLVVWARAL